MADCDRVPQLDDLGQALLPDWACGPPSVSRLRLFLQACAPTTWCPTPHARSLDLIPFMVSVPESDPEEEAVLVETNTK